MALNNIHTVNAACRRSVLLVDANARNLQFLSTLLKRFAYDVTVAPTAEAALHVAAAVRPVLIVTSRKLDGDNTALDLIRTYQWIHPAGTASFIMFSARHDPAFERACLKAGALTCLRSPIMVEDLYRVLQVAIEPIPRMNIRISADLPAAVNGTRQDESVRTISENGAYLATKSLYPLKTRLPVRIRLSNCIVTADAEVLYAHRASDDRKARTGMGLQFVRISQQDQQRIRMFIRSEMSKGIDPLQPAR